MAHFLKNTKERRTAISFKGNAKRCFLKKNSPTCVKFMFIFYFGLFMCLQFNVKSQILESIEKIN